MSFWSESASAVGESKDPKRNFRFQVTFTGLSTGRVWFAKKVGKPNFTITESTHDFFNHKFYYPGRVEWQPIQLTLVDPVDPNIDTAAQMSALVEAAGYEIPANSTTPLRSMSKGKAVDAIGAITIAQLDADGNEIETWTLTNPFIKTLKFGDLDYSSDDLTEMEMEIRYDFATWTSTAAGSKNMGTPSQNMAPKTEGFFGPKNS
tara:strand:- start:2284 stop:2898 length:615 start_codon:yes stop_codon:yes gene_type:complete